jgi:type I restriction enzyme S subunit
MKQLKWPVVQFADILERVERKIILDDAETYDCVGVRWYGMGAFIRESKLGMDIRRKKQWIIKEGDVVYNKLFAWRGAFAVAHTEVDGCIVSDKFPTYRLDEELVDSRYLRYYFRTDSTAKQAQDLSKGAAAISKLTLNPPDFWRLTVPLPSLEEQRRIVACIEELEALIQEAQGLRVKAREEAEALLPSAIGGFCSQLTSSLRPLAEVLAVKPSNGWSPRCDNDPSGTPVLTLSAITGFRYDGTQIKTTSLPIRGDARYWLQKDDLLISRSNTLELVGHAAIYDGFPERCIYPDLVMRTQVKEDEADVRFVHYWLMSPLVRDFIRNRARGTSPTMKKIAQRDVMEIPFPKTIGLAEQRCLVAYLDELQAQVDELTALQDATQAELDALLPSVLDRAFRGEL